ncbi:MAG TPA: hypothetical protein PKM88_14995, partial [bacterium]|nr:hypothetical protein [bacterium]
KLDDSLKSGAVTGEWPARRPAWRTALRASETMAALVPLTLEWEQQLQDRATAGAWKTRRAAWRQEVSALGR